MNLYGFQEGVRPTERKELFTVHRPRHFFLPHQKVVFLLFEGKFSFFQKIHEFFAKQNKFERPGLQSSQSPIVSIRHVLNHFILLLWLPFYIVVTTLNKWRRFRFFKKEIYNNPKQSVWAFNANW